MEINCQISAITQFDNSHTQKGVAEMLNLGCISRSQSFIGKNFKKIEITRKILSLIPIERNSTRVFGLIPVYANELNEISLDILVFLDETGLNFHSANHYDYSHKNTRLI